MAMLREYLVTSAPLTEQIAQPERIRRLRRQARNIYSLLRILSKGKSRKHLRFRPILGPDTRETRSFLHNNTQYTYKTDATASAFLRYNVVVIN